VIFEDPHAEFFGPASVGPDEYGRPSVEVTVEHSIPAIQEGFDLAAIQLGSKTLPDGTKFIGIGGGAPNRARATVQTKEGVFETAPSWEYRFSDWSPDTPLTLRFTPMKSEYKVDEPAAIPGQGGRDSGVDPVSIPKLIRARFRDEAGHGFRF